VHGARNRESTSPITNAPGTDTTDAVILFTDGFHLSGTSIENHFPYQRRSFISHRPMRMASEETARMNGTRNARDPTVIPSTAYRPNPIAK